MNIHSTAIVDSEAELAEGVEVGPYAVINGEVAIGTGTKIMAHAFIDRYTRIGADCTIFPSAVIGTQAQDYKYKGERAETVIGDRVIVREFATIHRASGEGQQTVIGDDSFIMANAHVAHNCRVGRGVILETFSGMAGHVTIGDFVTVSAMAGIHQFVRIGLHAFLGAFSRVGKDVPPFMLGEGAHRFELHGPNQIGLRRKGFSSETIEALKGAFRIICRNTRPLAQVLDEAQAAFPDVPEVQLLVDFMRMSKRGVYR